MHTRFSAPWSGSAANLAAFLGLALLAGCNPHRLDASLTQFPPRQQATANSLSGAFSSELPELPLEGIAPLADKPPATGVLAACPPATPVLAQPEWHLPGYWRIEARRCDGQYVTCGDAYPCAEPTPKPDGGVGYTGYGYVFSTDGQPSF